MLLQIFASMMLTIPEWSAIFAPEGELLVEGDPIQRERLARTLEKIAKEGPGAFYKVAFVQLSCCSSHNLFRTGPNSRRDPSQNKRYRGDNDPIRPRLVQSQGQSSHKGYISRTQC